MEEDPVLSLERTKERKKKGATDNNYTTQQCVVASYSRYAAQVVSLTSDFGWLGEKKSRRRRRVH